MSATRYYQVLNALIDQPPPSRTTRYWSSGCAGAGDPAADASARRLGIDPRLT